MKKPSKSPSADAKLSAAAAEKAAEIQASGTKEAASIQAAAAVRAARVSGVYILLAAILGVVGGIGGTLIYQEVNPTPSPECPVCPATPPPSPSPPAGGAAAETGLVPWARITSPINNAHVRETETVYGEIIGQPGDAAYLVIKSASLGEIYFPQALIAPNQEGRWEIPVIFGTAGYPYQLFVLLATTEDARSALDTAIAREAPLSDLPEGTDIISSEITVTRD